MATFSQKLFKCRMKLSGDKTLSEASRLLEDGERQENLFVSELTQTIKCGTRAEFTRAVHRESDVLSHGDQLDRVHGSLIPLSAWVDFQYENLEK